MGRQRMTVNDKNAFDLRRYFERAFKLSEYELYQVGALRDGRRFVEAQRALESLAPYRQGDESKYTLETKLWVETYISESGFKRALNAVRQKKYRTIHARKKRHIDLPLSLFFDLEEMANGVGLSKHQVLEKIIKQAHNHYTETKTI